MKRPPMGSPVTFTATIYKEREEDGQVRWIEEPCAETAGFYVGHRTVYEGKVMPQRKHANYDGFDVDITPAYLAVSRSVPHALVAPTERKNHARVPFSALTWEAK